MNAFFGSELDLQLRHRRCETVGICAVATNFGVEATAWATFEFNYHIMIASDGYGSIAAGLRDFTVENILSRIARVRKTAELDA